jgi:hypothetical protein
VSPFDGGQGVLDEAFLRLFEKACDASLTFAASLFAFRCCGLGCRFRPLGLWFVF